MIQSYIKTLEEVLSACNAIEIKLVNGLASEAIWDELVAKWHYLGYKKMFGPRVKYLVYAKNNVLAALSFNRASLHVGVRDEWLAWSDAGRHKLLPHLVNNNRFLILPWVRVKNLASYILSKTLKRLPADWLNLYGIRPYAVETFVDTSRYEGTCYKAANWLYLGETKGFGKAGKAFEYHGKKKAVFFYVLNRKLHLEITRFPRSPFSEFKREMTWDMMLSTPDWSPTLFEEAGLNEDSVLALTQNLTEYMDYFSPGFSRKAQQENAETYVKGLLSDLGRKSIEPIALRYGDENMVRTLQQFQKNSTWNDKKIKELYQARVLENFAEPEGMLTVDGCDFEKKGNHSAGVARQYCGELGKVENCQAGVFIGFSGTKGYGLLDARLYIPQKWFEESHAKLRKGCDMLRDEGEPQIEFKTKNEIALALINELDSAHGGLPFKWVGGDGAFGCDSEFRHFLPDGVYVFADVHITQLVYQSRPEWNVPPRRSKFGKSPTVPVPGVSPVPISAIISDESIPWERIVIAMGSKGPIFANVKCCRVIECTDGKDVDEIWLYIRKYDDGKIRASFSNAPANIAQSELNNAATLRWPIEQSFEECKSNLGMGDYETRSYVAWHRHMLLVMLAHLFVLETRFCFLKKMI